MSQQRDTGFFALWDVIRLRSTLATCPSTQQHTQSGTPKQNCLTQRRKEAKAQRHRLRNKETKNQRRRAATLQYSQKAIPAPSAFRTVRASGGSTTSYRFPGLLCRESTAVLCALASFSSLCVNAVAVALVRCVTSLATDSPRAPQVKRRANAAKMPVHATALTFVTQLADRELRRIAVFAVCIIGSAIPPRNLNLASCDTPAA